MKKKLFIILSVLSILLVGCSNHSIKPKQIDPEKRFLENGTSIEETFNKKMDQWQYIKDFEDFLSYNILSITEDKPFGSDLFISAEFDERSSLQGGIRVSQKKISESRNFEFSDIDFSVKAIQQEKTTEPFDLSGSLSILHKDGEMYAKLHDLDVFMGDGNMVAKMYTLLGDLWMDNWVDLEVHSGGIIKVDEDGDKELPQLIGMLKNVLTTQNIESSPSFLGSVVELVDIVNSYIDLGVSIKELTLLNYEVSYSELTDKTIQKEFTGSFQGKESAFNLSFLASEKGLTVHLYNIREYNGDLSDYEDTEKEFTLSLNEDKKSEYLVNFEILNTQQKVLDLQGEIEYGDVVKFSADFVLEPLKIMVGERILGKLNGNVVKKSGEGDKRIPELTGNVLLWSELVGSL